MRILASWDLARPICWKILGPTNAMMPASRMKTITISSIVKPPWRRGRERDWVIGFSSLLDRNVVHGEHGGQDRDDDEPDHQRHGHDHHRLQQRERLADRDLDLAVVGLRDLHQHVV